MVRSAEDPRNLLSRANAALNPAIYTKGKYPIMKSGVWKSA